MRTLILQTLLLTVLPISCKFYLYRELAPTGEALEVLNKIEATYQLAHKNRDIDLLLSLFDKSLKVHSCGLIFDYEDFEKLQRAHPFYKFEEKETGLDSAEAVIEGDLLKVVIVAKDGSGEKVQLTAVRRGADFKITSLKYEGGKCPSIRGYLQQEVVGEYIF